MESPSETSRSNEMQLRVVAEFCPETSRSTSQVISKSVPVSGEGVPFKARDSLAQNFWAGSNAHVLTDSTWRSQVDSS